MTKYFDQTVRYRGRSIKRATLDLKLIFLKCNR
jgi:hypothetical protein